MTKILICGAGGKMGRVIASIAKDRKDIKIIGGVDKFADSTDFDFPVFKNFDKFKSIECDCLIDFSRPDALSEILNFCENMKCGAVLATTGYTDAQKQQINAASKKIAIFQSFNMSLGINLLSDLINRAANFLGDDFDIEIIEKHHSQKVDAPSGTAYMLADSAASAFKNGKKYVYDRHNISTKRDTNEIGISSVRGGNIVGEHEVMFIGRDETITLSHKAASKEIFALGAVKAAIFLKGKKAGKYDMSNLTK